MGTKRLQHKLKLIKARKKPSNNKLLSRQTLITSIVLVVVSLIINNWYNGLFRLESTFVYADKTKDSIGVYFSHVNNGQKNVIILQHYLQLSEFLDSVKTGNVTIGFENEVYLASKSSYFQKIQVPISLDSIKEVSKLDSSKEYHFMSNVLFLNRYKELNVTRNKIGSIKVEDKRIIGLEIEPCEFDYGVFHTIPFYDFIDVYDPKNNR